MFQVELFGKQAKKLESDFVENNAVESSPVRPEDDVSVHEGLEYLANQRATSDPATRVAFEAVPSIVTRRGEGDAGLNKLPAIPPPFRCCCRGGSPVTRPTRRSLHRT